MSPRGREADDPPTSRSYDPELVELADYYQELFPEDHAHQLWSDYVSEHGGAR